ncbi:hypothetical protein LTR86_003846 [Recurvomyces mirabilis]|nr:hypothetical protein LTR86_003846 [Recurvomyces mirabilis]
MPSASCLCGACRFQIDSITGTGICHCTNCRKVTGSCFSLNAIVNESALHLTSGSPKGIDVPGDTGVTSTLRFCGDCGSPLWFEYPPRPDLRVVKAGLLDEEETFQDLTPMVEQFTKRRPQWLCAATGASQFEGQQGTEETGEELKDVMLQQK